MLLPQSLFSALVVNWKHTNTTSSDYRETEDNFAGFSLWFTKNMRLLHKFHVYVDTKKFNLRIYEQRDQNVHLITVSEFGKYVAQNWFDTYNWQPQQFCCARQLKLTKLKMVFMQSSMKRTSLSKSDYQIKRKLFFILKQ